METSSAGLLRSVGAGILLAGLVSGCVEAGEGATERGVLADTIWLEDLTSRPIAGLDDNPLHQVVDAAILDDRIAIAEEDGRILIFGRSGEPVASTGGAGDGPGEFRRIEWIQSSGDRWVVYDNSLNRVTTFDAGGALLETFSLTPPSPYERSFAVGALPDGSFLARSPALDDPRPEEGPYRPTWVVHRFDAGGTAIDSIGAYLGSERHIGQTSSGMFVSGFRPYGRETGAVLAGTHLWVAENVRPRIERWDVDRRSAALLMIDDVPEMGEVTPEEVAIMRERWAEDNVPGIDFGAILDEIGTAGTFPIFGWGGSRELRMLVASDDEHVWILHYGGVRGQGPVWTVMGEAGVRARVASEEQASILAVGGGLAVALLWDDFDVERIEVFPIPW